MSKPKRINLNQFERVTSIEDIRDGGLILVPQGDLLPETYWKRIPDGPRLLDDVSNSEWCEEARIETKGRISDYDKRVDWWINNAKNDPVWKDKVEGTFKHHGFDPWKTIGKGVGWLKSRMLTQRKSHLKKFFWNRLTSDYNWYLRSRGL